MPAQRPEDVHALLAAAFNSGDIDAFVEVYEEDAAHLVPPTGERVSGRDALRAALAPIFARRPSARIEVVGKLQRGELALTHGLWKLALTGPDGNREDLEGRGTIVSRRQPDGSWRIVLDDPTIPAVGEGERS